MAEYYLRLAEYEDAAGTARKALELMTKETQSSAVKLEK